MLSVPDFEVVVFALLVGAHRLDEESVTKIHSDKVANVGLDRLEAGDVSRILRMPKKSIKLKKYRHDKE